MIFTNDIIEHVFVDKQVQTTDCRVQSWQITTIAVIEQIYNKYSMYIDFIKRPIEKYCSRAMNFYNYESNHHKLLNHKQSCLTQFCL